MDTKSFQYIDTEKQLLDFCNEISSSQHIGFDTEFVSENRYRPELCLLQVAADDQLALIDTIALQDISPFWELLTSGDHVTIAHAAREEFLFCHRACGKRPKKLLDIQLAAGFVGYDFPASYSNLVSQILGEFVAKGETRTDWKRRPLSDKQIQYAIGDVVHLGRLTEKITALLKQSGRYDWYTEEVELWMDELVAAEHSLQWGKISGAAKLNRRSLGILQELWKTREAQAKNENRSPKRIIPDDLMIELAKRASPNVDSFRSIRGFDSRVSRKMSAKISLAVETGLAIGEKDLPKKIEKNRSVNLGLVGQFLSTVLNVVCRSKNIAPTLVGTSQEIRNYAAWRLGHLPKRPAPTLSQGWRSEIVGEAIDKAVNGKLAIRVDNPKSDQPLAIEELS